MLKTNPLFALAIAASAMLTGCGATGPVIAPQMQAAPMRAMSGDAGCATGMRLYGSFGTFRITRVTGTGKWAGEGTVLASLSATPDSTTKGNFKGELVLQNVTAAQLKPGTVIKGFVDYTCVVNNTIQPLADPYNVSNVQIVK